MGDEKYTISLWKFILLSLCMVGGSALVIYAVVIMQPLPLLIGSILIAIPITITLNALMKKIADIRFERQWNQRH